MISRQGRTLCFSVPAPPSFPKEGRTMRKLLLLLPIAALVAACHGTTLPTPSSPSPLPPHSSTVNIPGVPSQMPTP